MPLRYVTIWLGALTLLGGCVERRLVIYSAPPGTIVYDERNIPIGATPVDKPFTYYGNYQFRFVKDGYETLVLNEKIRAPWYQWPGLDFISENLIPWTIRDVRPIYPVLQPLQVVPPEQIMQQAEQLRNVGKTIGTPLPTTPAPTLPELMPPVP